jgi:hypothetical protein
LFKGVFLLKTHRAEVVHDIDQLVEDLSSSYMLARLPEPRSATLEAIEGYRRSELLFEAIARGTREDCLSIERILGDDPKKFLRTRTDPDSLPNRANAKGLRPIYEAAMYGHLDVVTLLFEYGADPQLLSRVSDAEQENSLDVACRWTHVKVVNWLLITVKWSKQELKDASAKCPNKELKSTVLGRIPGFSWFGCCSINFESASR